MTDKDVQAHMSVAASVSEERVETLLNGGHVDLHKTHPNLWRMVLLLGVGCLLLAANFFILQPTFPIFHAPNELWGTFFAIIGVGELLSLLVFHNLRLVRASLAAAVAYFLLVGFGTCEPWLDGNGSLQLPILYLGIAVLQIPLLLEPFINPMTSRAH